MEKSLNWKARWRFPVIVAAVLGLVMSMMAVVAPQARAVIFATPIKTDTQIQLVKGATFTKGTSRPNLSNPPTTSRYLSSESPKIIEPTTPGVDGNFSIFAPDGSAVFRNETGWEQMYVYDAYGSQATQRWVAYCIDPLDSDPGSAGSYTYDPSITSFLGMVTPTM